MDTGQVKTGDDKNDTYVKLLQQILRITPPIAYGIAAEYPNVRKLVQGMREEGPLMLEDLKVCRFGKKWDIGIIDVGELTESRNRQMRMGR